MTQLSRNIERKLVKQSISTLLMIKKGYALYAYEKRQLQKKWEEFSKKYFNN